MNRHINLNHSGHDSAAITEPALDQLLSKARARFERSIERIRRPSARIAIADSQLGPLLVAESERGLLTVRFADLPGLERIVEILRQKFDLSEDSRLAVRIAQEIAQLMSGDPSAISKRRVDLSLVESSFQRRALERLCKVPAGSVVSYQALAAAVGAPSGQRAIGNTVADNPIAIYVPCHRVIRSDGSIGNYGGGVERKLRLLRAEGFAVDRAARVPDRAVYGHWTSRIFCRPECSAVRRAERKKWIIFADADRARSSGMRACKLCRPL